MRTEDPRLVRLEEVLRLRESGLFRDALEAFDALQPSLNSQTSSQVVRAELLERVGRGPEAQSTIQKALASRSIGASDRSLCDFVLARIEIDSGDFEAAIRYLNGAVVMARKAGDVERTCNAQLKLLTVLSDGIGTDATGPLLAEVRANAARTGSPRMLAAVHTYFAQIEALRGSVQNARRHIRLAHQLLQRAPSVWLESVIENIALALSIIASEFEIAEIHARRGSDLAHRTGGTTEYAINQGNTGYLWQMLGRLEDAVECYERAIRHLVPGSEAHSGAIDSLARVRLAQDRLSDCESLLSQIHQPTQARGNRATYVFRHVMLTRAQLSIKKGDGKRSSEQLEQVLRLAHEAGDRLLVVSGLLAKVDLLLNLQEVDKVAAVVEQITALLSDQSAHVFAKYQRALGRFASAVRNTQAAQDHLRRAERVYLGLHHVQDLTELRKDLENCDSLCTVDAATDLASSSTLQSCATILSCARHPEVLARELVAVLFSTGSILRAAIVRRSEDGRHEALVDFVGPETTNEPGSERRLVVGQALDKSVEVLIHEKGDMQSRATVHAARQLLSCAMELRALKDDRNERSTIWPAEDLPLPHCDAVLSGQMRELTTFAQRVARTTVNVLITGGMDRYEYRQNRGSRRAREDRRAPRPGSAVAHWSVPAAA
jgi:tetratricopeptide (TPR) repeat protein